MRRLFWKLFGVPDEVPVYYTIETSIVTDKLKAMTKHDIYVEVAKYLDWRRELAIHNIVNQLERIKEDLP